MRADAVGDRRRLKAVKLDPCQIIVSIIGPEAARRRRATWPRLPEFASQFGANGLDLPGAAASPAHRPASRSRSSHRSIRDCATTFATPTWITPGLQANCTVEDFVNNPDGTRTSSRLPNCDASAPPCWRMIREQRAIATNTSSSSSARPTGAWSRAGPERSSASAAPTRTTPACATAALIQVARDAAACCSRLSSFASSSTLPCWL